MKELAYYLSKFCTIFHRDDIQEKVKYSILNEDLYWVQNMNLSLKSVKNINVGDVYFFQFGKNLSPAISFKHMGVVISKNSKYLYVLPITSYNKSIHKDVYDVGTEEKVKKSFFLMRKEDFDFLYHDSVLKTNDIKCVPVNSINSDLITKIDINSDFFKKVYDMCFKAIFNDYSYELDKMKEQLIKQLDEELSVTRIIVDKGEKIDIHNYIKGYYGSLKEEIIIDTSQVGEYVHTLDFIDDFGNMISKDIVVFVIKNADKMKSDYAKNERYCKKT